MNIHPIGILDSGLGGLSIGRKIIQELPQESTIYIADSAHTPYGKRSSTDILSLSKKMIEFLLQKHVKAIVVACNTITVVSIASLREAYPDVPIIGTVPAIKPAASLSKKKRIGMLSTTGTAQSEYQKNLIKEFAADCIVITHGTDTLVPLIEQGIINGKQMTNTLQEELAIFKEKQIDTLVLGCTHYPLLKSQIAKILGPDVTVLDSGEAIAKQVRRVLENNGDIVRSSNPYHKFYTTGTLDVAKKVLSATIGDEQLTFVSTKV
jgi:glutamate racemase